VLAWIGGAIVNVSSTKVSSVAIGTVAGDYLSRLEIVTRSSKLTGIWITQSGRGTAVLTSETNHTSTVVVSGKIGTVPVVVTRGSASQSGPVQPEGQWHVNPPGKTFIDVILTEWSGPVGGTVAHEPPRWSGALSSIETRVKGTVDILVTRLPTEPWKTETVELVQWRQLFCCVRIPTLNAIASIFTSNVSTFIDVDTTI
jgi:hypothetical protein